MNFIHIGFGIPRNKKTLRTFSNQKFPILTKNSIAEEGCTFNSNIVKGTLMQIRKFPCMLKFI